MRTAPATPGPFRFALMIVAIRAYPRLAPRWSEISFSHAEE